MKADHCKIKSTIHGLLYSFLKQTGLRGMVINPVGAIVKLFLSSKSHFWNFSKAAS